jgi:nitroreductase
MDSHLPLSGAPSGASSGAMDMLLSRASAQALQHPAPDAADLDAILAAGLRAPDHGRLRPWRFIIISGDDRAAFAEIAIAALRARQPDAPESEATRMRGKLLTPPLIVALGVHIVASEKIPEIEQMMAVGAAAMNMLNAAHALGYGGKWVTGPNAYDPAVARALGLAPPDRLAGFLYLGTPAGADLPLTRPSVAAHRLDWHGTAP